MKCEGCGIEAILDADKLCSRCAFFSDVELRVWDGVRAFAPNISRTALLAQLSMCVVGRSANT